VLFSCKISNAFIKYLENRNEDLSFIYDSTDFPIDLIQDPSAWMSSPDLEFLISKIVNHPFKERAIDLVKDVGHQTPDLHAWGVLDSVLKMISHPREVFNQPDRFISYFISPEPPIENLVRTNHSIAFDLPLMAEQYPLVSKYLMAAFEALPLYTGKSLGQCSWQHIHVKINWPSESETLVKSDAVTAHLSPTFLQNIIEELQINQKNLEEKNRELMEKNVQLLNAQKELNKNNPVPSTDIEHIQLRIIVNNDLDLNQISQNLARLHDYMVRAQQLITMLTGQIKMNSGIKEIMRRIDWDHVKSQYPVTILESMETLRKLQKKN
jgi:polyhydroxyalkanoate synthesis regulator phasin